MNIAGNLDCEARWAGVTLPAQVASRISVYASLLAAFARDGEAVDVWAPAAVDPARLVAYPRWRPPAMHVGAPPRVELAWAAAGDHARAANDRARALAIAESLGVALPGTRLIASVDELDAHLAAGGAATATGRWVAKARWTAAGRDRVHGAGDALAGETRAHAARMLRRFGPLVFEPWVDRVLDVGVCATIAADGSIAVAAPHGLRCDERGGFSAITLDPPALTAREHDELAATARAAAGAVAAGGYRGPLGIDAFAYLDPITRTRRLRPICELNARYTFGFVARALADRLGTRRLGFSPAPAGATVLVTPGADHVTAWVA